MNNNSLINGFRILTLSLIIPLLSFKAFSQQNEKVGSMYQRLEMVTGKEKFEVYKDIFAHYYDRDFDRALEVADFAYAYAKQYGDSNLVRAGRMRGVVLTKVDNVDEAIVAFNEALSIANNKNFIILSKFLLTDLGNAYTAKGQLDKALEYQFKTLIIREREGIKDEISLTLGNIGTIYSKLGNPEKAKEYYTQSLAIKEEINELYVIEELLINLSLTYSELQKNDSALLFIDRGLKICDDNCNSKIIMSGKNALGVAYLGLKKYHLAESAFNESLKISQEFGDKLFQAYNLSNLAEVNLLKGDNQNIYKYLNLAEAISISSGYNQVLINIYNQFSNYYYNLNDFQNAAHYQHKYIELKDSLMGNQLAQNLAAIQSEYEQRTHLAAIAQKDELLKRERYLVYAIGLIAILVITLVFIFIRVYFLKVKYAQQKKLGQVETQVTERERKNLAKELHDGVGTDLIAVKLRVMNLLDQHAINTIPSQEIEEQFQMAIKTIKEISYGLTPPGLDRYGLNHTLSNYFNKITESATIPIDFNSSGSDIKNKEIAITIFRVLQELIGNTLKHAQAKSIRINLTSFDDLINVLFEDDGVGFSRNSVAQGLGLQNMESRVQSIGGNMVLESSSIGTFYSIDIPLKRPEKID